MGEKKYIQRWVQAYLGILLEELETVGYIEIKDGKVYPVAKGKSKSTKIKSA